ncbi:MAG: hypothetical protein A2157_19115 [Deltaproteobacteria bacterium RBG_16_47_11]|nr:MAG: hypothetical protein A2157_19115 [Deltaproteobacteria bacterium RBG_16_47_11]
MEIFSLKGKKAFVSGASRGLGREISITLAEAGADVVLASRNMEALNETAGQIRKLGRDALVCPMDISKLDDIERSVNDAFEAFGDIEILVNNSGVAGEGPVVDMAPETWDYVMNVNLRGHVFCSKAVGRHMIEKRYGKIINIASVAGIDAVIYNSSYCVSKAALIMFTKSLALEWARYNIQVNALCPGVFLTDLNREFFMKPVSQKVMKKIPMRRLADVKEIRGAVLLLASEASSFMTGSVLVIDGGRLAG